MIRLLGFFSLILCASLAGAEPQKDFSKQIYVVGVGQVKLDYLYTGEPISRPQALRIYVKCEKSQVWNPVGVYQMCELDRYEYDSKAKKLIVKYLDGRVNAQTGESFCDQAGTDELDLKTLCKK